MRVKQIDALRGIAAIIVTFFHLTGNSGLSKTTASYGSYGWVGVQVFFVISGFVLPYSLHRSNYNISNFFKFIVKRLIRIYPAYLAAIVIGIILAAVTHRELLSAYAIVSHLFFLNDLLSLPFISPVLWTLAIEFQFYILIGLSYPILIKGNFYSLIFLVLISIIGASILPFAIFHWFPYFALGILIFYRFFKGLSLPVFGAGIILLLTIILFNDNITCALAATLAAIFILFYKVENDNWFNQILLGLGSISYSLYLVHWELGRAAISISKKIPLIGSTEPFLIFIGFIFSILSACLLYKYIERPSLEWSSKIKYTDKS